MPVVMAPSTSQAAKPGYRAALAADRETVAGFGTDADVLLERQEQEGNDYVASVLP